jgi:DNA helicase-2/ATP-dependent DNA helicase PcrA
LKPPASHHPIVEEELQLLARVLRALDEDSPRRSTAEPAIVEELERLRTLIVSGADQKDRLALLSQWDRASALLRQIRAGRSGPQVDPSTPYFAHIRLREAGKERDVLLGKASFIKPGVRVVDWRQAPISRLFYRYRQGEQYEEELAGRLRIGRLSARRTVSVIAAALRRIDAPEGRFLCEAAAPERWVHTTDAAPELQGGEGRALRSSAASAPAPSAGAAPARLDRRLPEIAALLDEDQFELLSRPGPGVLALRGSAGSGKTTVALHRIAFLAFEDAAIDSPATLFVTLSPALRDYVAYVLPSLGVGRVPIVTFEDWAASQRRRLCPDLPRVHRNDTPDYVRRLKLHPGIGRALADHVAEHPAPPTPRQALDDWSSVLTRPAHLRRVLAVDTGAPSERELGLAAEWCRVRNEEIAASLEGEGRAELDPEDDALLLRAWQLRIGPLPMRGAGAERPLSYRHLAIDEVQDFAAVELQVLVGCQSEPVSLTLAGDLQQRVGGAAESHGWEGLFRLLGLAEADLQTLRVSYRSTHQITEFSLGVLGSEAEADSRPETVRDGPPVEHFEFSESGECIAFLADALHRLAAEEPLASVAVLTPNPESSALYYQGLEASEVPRLEWVRAHRFSFRPGVAVAEIEQAKGLEFDYVILVDANRKAFPATPLARRLFHVGVTRAIHQLWITCTSAPSPLIGEGAHHTAEPAEPG